MLALFSQQYAILVLCGDVIGSFICPSSVSLLYLLVAIMLANSKKYVPDKDRAGEKNKLQAQSTSQQQSQQNIMVLVDRPGLVSGNI